MSIATAITTAQGRVANAYTAVSTKGGTLPATQNLTNLPDAILSIPSGGGDTVIACAYGAAENYSEGDKVLLNPPSSVDRVPVDWTSRPATLFDLTGVTFVTNSKASIRKSQWNNVPILSCIGDTFYFDGDLHPVSEEISTALQDCEMNLLSKSDKVIMYRNMAYYNDVFGFISDDYRIIHDCTVRYNRYTAVYPFQYVYKFNYIGAANDAAIFYVDTVSQQITQINTVANHLFFYKEGGTVYEVCVDGKKYALNGTSTPVYVEDVTIPATTYDYAGKVIPLNDTASYVLVKDSLGNVHLWERSGTTWTIVKGFDNAYTDIYGNSSGDIFLFNKSTKAQFYGSVDLTTGDVVQSQNVFLSSELPTTIDQYAINLEDKIALVAENSTDTCVIKNIDSAIPYQYCAVAPAAGDFSSSSLTGYVTENHGRNVMGYVTLTVETVQDPDTPPWSDIGIVFGMSITVNEGVI